MVTHVFALLLVQGFTMEWCKQPDVGLPRPDLVLYLTLSTKAAAARGNYGEERYEQTEFQASVMKNFNRLKDTDWQVGLQEFLLTAR